MHISSLTQQLLQTSLRVALCASVASTTAILARAQSPTAVPVQLLQTLDSAHLNPGELVRMKTMQPVVLPQGRVRKAAILEGHVVAEQAYRFSSGPYAKPLPATLSIQVDAIETDAGRLPVQASLRALAGPLEVDAAGNRQYQNEFDTQGTMRLIGGEELWPWDKTIRGKDSAVVGYVRKQGNIAPLLGSVRAQANDEPLHCAATQHEEAIAVFSADACGLYGMDKTVLTNTGAAQGAITLQRANGDVHVERGSAALLLVSAL
jgi:hypothetical protein